MGLFSNLGNGYLGVLGNFSGGLGSGLNKLTGATQSANLQQKYNLVNGAVNQGYALQSAAINNAYQKEFAQNAHQWEVEDLKRAGLNPVLSAGGSGASASGGGVSSGATSGAGLANSGINPLDVILNGVSTMTTAQRTKAETRNLDTEQEMKAMQTLLLAKQAATETKTQQKIDQEIRNMITEIQLKINQQEIGHFGEWLGTGIIKGGKQTIETGANALADIASLYTRKGEGLGRAIAQGHYLTDKYGRKAGDYAAKWNIGRKEILRRIGIGG